MHESRKQIPYSLVLFLLVIAIVNALADINSWYWTHRWFDMPMHFAGGVWLAWFALWWRHSRVEHHSATFLFTLGICLLFALGVGFFWEIYEAIIGFATVGHMNAISDTLSDLFFDSLGGMTVAVIAWLRVSLNKLP